MEMEHINEDTIRVVIDNSDLEKRGITFLDLLGNQKQIENFFYSILEEVDVDEEFQETDAVTFQVMPNKNGLELFISKGATFREDFLDAVNSQMELSASDSDMEEFSEQQQLEQLKDEIDEDDDSSVNELVLVFESFEDIISLAQSDYWESEVSHLYHLNKQYYLMITQLEDEMVARTIEEERAIALEYGEKSDVSADILEEYGNKLIDSNALEVIRHHFSPIE